MAERKPKYNEGHDDAIESVIQLLTIYVEMFPAPLTEVVLATIMDTEEARHVLAPLAKFHERVIREYEGKPSAGEAAA